MCPGENAIALETNKINNLILENKLVIAARIVFMGVNKKKHGRGDGRLRAPTNRDPRNELETRKPAAISRVQSQTEVLSFMGKFGFKFYG